MTPGRPGGTFVLGLCCISVVAVAQADLAAAQAPRDAVALAPGAPVHGATDDRPWAIGVSEADQRRAFELFADGNKLFDELRFARAAAAFERALGHWRHPAIHFNLALALVHLDRPVEAHAHVIEALRYEGAALEARAYREALRYRKLLERQLVELEIDCSQQGVEISLDGEVIATGPVSVKRWVLPGTHRVVATKSGYATVTQSVELASGRAARISVTMYPFSALTARVRRWRPWVPWAVFAAGVGVAGIGAGMHLRGRADVAAFDEALRVNCPGGCDPEDDAVRHEYRRFQRAQWMQPLGVSGYAVGAAVAIGGLALVYANRTRTVHITRESVRLSIGDSPDVAITPVVTARAAWLAARFSF